jgi:hypothetical protein
MYDHLVDHALKTVWCAPLQDTQMIVKPVRLTPYGGVWNQFNIFWRVQPLPHKNGRFHVFQIGQLHPALMGLFPVGSTWINLATVCNQENLIVDIYADSGGQMPRHRCWYIVTEDKNLLIAVEEQTRVPIDFNYTELYFRFYSNAYFNTTEADAAADFIEVVGGNPNTTEEILALQHQFNVARNRATGFTYAFVNGNYVSAINLFTVKPGDVVEYVYDGSIYRTEEFKIQSLPVFESELDNKYKYLIHPPKAQSRGIDYHDDLDVFLVKKAAGGDIGLFYHRNVVESVRMVTHHD